MKTGQKISKKRNKTKSGFLAEVFISNKISPPPTLVPCAFTYLHVYLERFHAHSFHPPWVNLASAEGRHHNPLSNLCGGGADTTNPTPNPCGGRPNLAKQKTKKQKTTPTFSLLCILAIIISNRRLKYNTQKILI